MKVARMRLLLASVAMLLALPAVAQAPFAC